LVALKLGFRIVACLPGLISMVVVMGMWSVWGGHSSLEGAGCQNIVQVGEVPGGHGVEGWDVLGEKHLQVIVSHCNQLLPELC